MVESPEKGHDQEEITNKIKSESLQYVFKPERDKFPNKLYHEDGNPDMYTKENC